MRTSEDRFSLIGSLNGHTERIFTAVTGAIQGTLGILTIANVWSKEIGASVQIAAAAWIVVAMEIVRARLAVLVKTDAASIEAADDERVGRNVRENV